MGVGSETEMLDCLTGVLGATDEDGVGSSGETGSDLVEGESLTTSSQDAGAGRGGEAESRNGELGKLEETVVVSDGADLICVSIFAFWSCRVPYNDDGLALVRLGRLLVGSSCDDAGQADGYHIVSEFVRQASRIRSAYEGG